MNLKISTLGAVMMLLLILATGTSVFISVQTTSGIHAIEDAWTRFDEVDGQKIKLSERLSTDLGFGGMIHHYKDYLLRGEEEGIKTVEAKIADGLKTIELFRKLDLSDRERADLDIIERALLAHEKALRKAVELTAQGKSPTEIDLATKIDDRPAEKAMRDLFVIIAEDEKHTSEIIHSVSDNSIQRAEVGTYVSTTGLVIVILALGWFLAYRLLPPLKAMTAAMGRLAQGDFETVVPATDRKDEVGDMARAVLVFKRNGEMVVEMEQSTDKMIQAILQTASEVGSAISEQAASSSEQAAAVNQTSTSLEEIRQTADNAIAQAGELSQSAEQAMQQGMTGQKNMDKAVAAMDDIREKVEAIARTMIVLSEQTRRVGEITDSVSSLAQQSKMLAINASIEAAKAGEAGKGFAVVADEVASLAEQSEEATVQVRTMLELIQAASEKAIFATEEGTKQVDSGIGLLQVVGGDQNTLMGVIEQTSSGTRDMVGWIRQQASGIEQVSNAMRDISAGTSQVATSTDQIRYSVDFLNGEVANLARNRS